jgi:simple sugar transport system substrate-binding protein
MSRRDLLKYSGAFGVLAATGGISRFAGADDPMKVGVAYVSSFSEVGWTKQHSLGAAAIREALGDKVEVIEIDNMWDPQATEKVFTDFARSGAKLIFGTSFTHSTPIQKVAPRFPDVAFEHCSGLKHFPNLGTFEAKYYEGTYLAGMASAMVTKSKKIGFIGGYPIPDIVGPGNALLLGAQSVDPDITCGVIFLNSWFDPAKEKEATAALIAQGCDVICSMTDTATGVQTAEENGAWSIGYATDMRPFGPTGQLTSFMLNWESIYVGAAEDVAAGTWESTVRYHGLKEGVIEMAPYNPALPQSGIDQINKTADGIASGTVHPWAGEIRDQDGKIRVPSGTLMPVPEVRSFNWFVEGMIGSMG